MALDRQTKRAFNALQERLETALKPAEAAPVDTSALATAADVARLEAKIDRLLTLLEALRGTDSRRR